METPMCICLLAWSAESFNQGYGVEVFGWSQIPKITRSWSQIFSPTPEVQLKHFMHCTPTLGILTRAGWYGTVSFEIFMETGNSCCVSRFPLISSCYKILDSQTSCYAKDSESEILETPESDILPQTPQPWLQ